MGFLLALLLAVPVAAQNITIAGPFTGINDTDATITLDPSQAQTALNVEVSDDGLALNKRAGYALTDTLTTTTSPVNGAISFKDATGRNIHLVASDNSIYTSIDGGAFTALLSTMPVNAKWDFCESGGTIYAFNDSHDVPWSWNGSVITYYADMPKASICAITTSRMLLAGTTDYPNRLYFSEAGDYTNFVVDIEVNSPSFDDIGLSGEKITALYATEAEWLIFKSNSFTSYQGTNQYDLVASVVSNRVGMGDPQAIVQHEGIVYFKGSDNKIWGYNSGTMVDTTKKLEATIALIPNTSAVLYKKYTSESDFNAGTFYNTTSSGTYGSIEPLKYVYSDTTEADFNNGTIDPALEVVNDSLYLASLGVTPNLGGYFVNIGAESNSTTNWTVSTDRPLIPSASFLGKTPSYGNYFFYSAAPMFTSFTGAYFSIYKSATDELVYTNSISGGLNVWTDKTISVDMSAYEDTNYYIEFKCNADAVGSGISCISTSFTRGTIDAVISHYNKTSTGEDKCAIDIRESSPSSSSGTFISQFHAIEAPTPHYGYFSNSSSVTTGSTIDFSIAFATATTGELGAWQSTSAVWCSTCPYYKWRAEIYATTNTVASPYVNSGSLTFQSTGYWLSDEVAAGVLTWGQFLADKTITGNADWTYTIAITTYAGGTDTATYESLTSGSLIMASTGTYVRLKAVNSFFSATDTVRTNDLSYSWNFATDKQSAAFEYLGNIYFSVPYNFSTTNNRILKLDTENTGWTIFDIPMNYPVVINDEVKFGSPTGGDVYRYPYGNTDNGAAIESYWKTKDFIGNNPYVEKEFQRISVISGTNGGSTLNVTYTLDTNESTTYAISLTSTTANFVRNNRVLPLGDTSQFFNLQIGNNAADQPWSFYGASIDYVEKPWRVLPEE